MPDWLGWVVISPLALLPWLVLLKDTLDEWRYHNDLTHCEWCAIELARWRVLLVRRYCSVCAPRMLGGAGIYGQSGGPPCSRGGRAGQTERGRRMRSRDQ